MCLHIPPKLPTSGLQNDTAFVTSRERLPFQLWACSYHLNFWCFSMWPIVSTHPLWISLSTISLGAKTSQMDLMDANSLFSIILLCFSAAAAAKSLQSCPTPCDPIDGSPLGSAVPGILQARTLEWVAISFSNAWKWKVKVKSLSRVPLLATPWTAAYQAPLPLSIFSLSLFS